MKIINLVSAIRGITENWQRTVLSAVGVMAATVAIVLLTGIALGVQKEFASQVEEVGVNNLIIFPGRIEGGFNVNIGGASYLKMEDAKRLLTVPGVLRASCWTFVGGGATYQGKRAQGSFLVATTPEWFVMHPMAMQEGVKLTEQDRGKAVCVLGSIAKDGLFGKQSALGKKMRVNGKDYTIIGVTEDKKAEEGLLSMGSMQVLIFIPYDYFHKLEPDAQTDRIVVQIDPKIEPTTLIKKLETELGKRLTEEQFSVLTQKDLLKLVFKFTGILTWLLTGLTSIALFVGGIGIMTVMLLSVGERATEIGIRKATGAQRSDIFQQFLVESAMIAVLGSAAGLLLSWGVSALLSVTTPIKPELTPTLLGGTILAALVCGIIFGLLPAISASKKDPVTAIQRGY